MDKEIWKKINGYEDYEISNYGNIRSFKRYPEGRLLKQAKNSRDGYLLVCLSKNGKQKTFNVHKLVALHFLGPANGLVVNHLSENRENNYASNLEYITQKENINYKTRTARQVATMWKNGHFEKMHESRRHAVNQYTKDGVFLNQFHSLQDACKYLGISPEKYTSICACAKHRIKSAYGYKWEYA